MSDATEGVTEEARSFAAYVCNLFIPSIVEGGPRWKAEEIVAEAVDAYYHKRLEEREALLRKIAILEERLGER